MLGVLADSTVEGDCSNAAKIVTCKGICTGVGVVGCGIAACAIWQTWHVQ
jgi:hypothetical protein